jgi:BppU N-terminal domain
MVTTIQSNSTGTVFRRTLLKEDGSVLDLTGATTLELVFTRPNETTFTRTASVVGPATDGTIEYVGLNAEFDMVGPWRWQARAVIPSGEWWDEVFDFNVRPNLVPAS